MIVHDVARAGVDTGKANFDQIYHAPDPREYFRVLVGLDYIIPDLAKGVFRSLIDYRRREADGVAGRRSPGRPVTIVDIGSSYGINAAVINHAPDIERLARRYSAPEMYQLSSDELRLLDRSYFESWPKLTPAHFIGVDTSVPAVSYGQAVGLLDGGVTSNLEEGDPSEAEQRLLRDTDLVISTGCVGYVTERTFRRVIACRRAKEPPIVASFVLRMYSYDRIADCLAEFGLVTEKLDGMTFVQRRFASQQECSTTVERLTAKGVDPQGKESDGLLHAELFVSRPEREVRRLPLGEIVSITNGERSTRGRRFKRVGDRPAEFVH